MTMQTDRQTNKETDQQIANRTNGQQAGAVK